MAPGNRPQLLGSDWGTDGFRQLGWRLMPLRLFLGITFLYASLQKLANPNYLRAGSATSVAAQMRTLESSSPIGPLLRLSLHAPTAVGLAIALGELVVALAILAGLWTRLAAVGGMLLSLTFFLTVSWATAPYYYGSDIVFLFAFTVFATCGAGGVLCVDAWIDARAAAGAARPPRGVDLTRRRFLVGARSAALLAGVAGALAGATGIIGRAAGGTRNPASASLGLGRARPRTSASGQASGHGARRSKALHGRRARSQSGATGTALAPVTAVPVGQGKRFTDPASGGPAWVVRPRSGGIVAFSAVCTHAGCVVAFDPGANEFVCPCHGGRYSARTGAVITGPPPAPLRRIPARIVNNDIRVD